MIFQKNTIFHMFFYQSLASGALVLVLVLQSLLITSSWNCVTDVIYNLFSTYFLMPIILKYLENNSSHLNDTIQ